MSQINSFERIKQEFMDISNNPILNICATVGLPNPSNIYEWKCSLSGPKDTPYENGLFFLKIIFPLDYTNSPPEVSFLTPIYHINVNPRAPKPGSKESLGHVCISTLNWWDANSNKANIRSVLTDIFALFYLGNPESPYGLERATELNLNKKLYDEKCRYFTQKYASMNSEEKVYTNDWDFSYPNMQAMPVLQNKNIKLNM